MWFMCVYSNNVLTFVGMYHFNICRSCLVHGKKELLFKAFFVNSISIGKNVFSDIYFTNEITLIIKKK